MIHDIPYIIEEIKYIKVSTPDGKYSATADTEEEALKLLRHQVDLNPHAGNTI